MTRFMCATCATQFADRDTPPPSCPICDDPRQYVGDDGQVWTTLSKLRATRSNTVAAQGDLIGIGSRDVGIGQRALLVPWGETNLLWDCVGLLDDVAINYIQERGGLGAIAISHPHFYSSMVEWAHYFHCPIYLHEADSEWIMRTDDAITLWSGDQHELGDGLSLHRLGGHFAGASALLQAAGSDRRGSDGPGSGGWGSNRQGTLLSGDMPLVARDRRWVTFMWSYPNMIPPPAHEVRRIADRLAELSFDTMHSAFWDSSIIGDASAVVQRSAQRYIDALDRVLG